VPQGEHLAQVWRQLCHCDLDRPGQFPSLAQLVRAGWREGEAPAERRQARQEPRPPVTVTAPGVTGNVQRDLKQPRREVAGLAIATAGLQDAEKYLLTKGGNPIRP